MAKHGQKIGQLLLYVFELFKSIQSQPGSSMSLIYHKTNFEPKVNIIYGKYNPNGNMYNLPHHIPPL